MIPIGYFSKVEKYDASQGILIRVSGHVCKTNKHQLTNEEQNEVAHLL